MTTESTRQDILSALEIEMPTDEQLVIARAHRAADVRLYKAAPALLAALVALRGDLLRYPNDDARREAIVDAADAAIAAACPP